MGQDIPHTRTAERLFAFRLHVSWYLLLVSKSITDLTNPLRSHGEFFICKKKLRRGTLFFLPTVEGISWINQALKTTVVKCHAEDSCKELNFNVTNNRLQQFYWNSRHHLICPARPVPTTTGLKGMFLPVWSPAEERSEKMWGDTVWIEPGCFGGLLCGDNAQL